MVRAVAVGQGGYDGVAEAELCEEDGRVPVGDTRVGGMRPALVRSPTPVEPSSRVWTMTVRRFPGWGVGDGGVAKKPFVGGVVGYEAGPFAT